MKKIVFLILVVFAFSCKKKSDDPAPSSTTNNGGSSSTNTPSDLSSYTWLVERHLNEDSVVFDRDSLFLGSLNQGEYSSSVQWNKAIEGDFTISFDVKGIKGSAMSSSGFAVMLTDGLVFTATTPGKQVITLKNTVNSNFFIPYTTTGTMGTMDFYTRTATYGTYTIQRTGSQITASITDIDFSTSLPVTHQKVYTNMHSGPVYLSLSIAETLSTKFEIKVANFNYKNAAGVTTNIPFTKNTTYVRQNNYK
jgi:hypothetical protein